MHQAHNFRALALFITLIALALTGCGSSGGGGSSTPPNPPNLITIGTVDFNPSTSATITRLGASYADVVLYPNWDDTRENRYSYSAALFEGIPCIQQVETGTQDGTQGVSYTLLFAKGHDGAVYILREIETSGATFTAGVDGDPSMYLPAVIVTGATYSGGYPARFPGGRDAPLWTMKILGTNVTTPSGLHTGTIAVLRGGSEDYGWIEYLKAGVGIVELQHVDDNQGTEDDGVNSLDTTIRIPFGNG